MNNMVCLHDLNAVLKMNTKTECVVFVYLCFSLGMNTTRCGTTVSEMSVALRVSRQSVSRAVSSLLSKGIVKREHGVLHVNPDVAWAGSSKARGYAVLSW
jgi:predicted DNA-binding transcriptional regulator